MYSILPLSVMLVLMENYCYEQDYKPLKSTTITFKVACCTEINILYDSLHVNQCSRVLFVYYGAGLLDHTLFMSRLLLNCKAGCCNILAYSDNNTCQSNSPLCHTSVSQF